MADGSAGEFASSRLRAYAETQELLLDNKQSTIRANGLKVVFYSRFFTTRGLIVSKRYDELLKDEDREALQKMRDLFLKLGSTDHHFKAIAQKKLLDFENDTVTPNEQLLKQDVFHQAVTDYFQDGTTALTFRRFEKAAWEKIPKDKSSFLLDDFNSLNRETLSYARRHLADDILRTTKNPERLQAFLKRNKLAIAIIVQPLFGAAMSDVYSVAKSFWR